MNRLITLLIFLCFSALIPLMAQAGIDFQQKNWDWVLQEAQKTNKPIFVQTYASYCLPCKVMQRAVFTDDELGTYYNDNFINYKVDMEGSDGGMFGVAYGVETLPTLLFFNPDGKIIEQTVGFKTKEELLGWGEYVMGESEDPEFILAQKSAKPVASEKFEQGEALTQRKESSTRIQKKEQKQDPVEAILEAQKRLRREDAKAQEAVKLEKEEADKRQEMLVQQKAADDKVLAQIRANNGNAKAIEKSLGKEENVIEEEEIVVVEEAEVEDLIVVEDLAVSEKELVSEESTIAEEEVIETLVEANEIETNNLKAEETERKKDLIIEEENESSESKVETVEVLTASKPLELEEVTNEEKAEEVKGSIEPLTLANSKMLLNVSIAMEEVEVSLLNYNQYKYNVETYNNDAKVERLVAIPGWEKPENLKKILESVQTINSPGVAFMLENRGVFIDYFGENVLRDLMFLVGENTLPEAIETKNETLFQNTLALLEEFEYPDEWLIKIQWQVNYYSGLSDWEQVAKVVQDNQFFFQNNCLINVADLLMEQEANKAALLRASQFIEGRKTESAEAMATLAHLYEKTGKKDEAKVCAQSAIDSNQLAEEKIKGLEGLLERL